jgi:hypothetical protein
MSLDLMKVRLNIFYTISLNKEQTLHGIVILFPLGDLKLRTLLQKLYSQIRKTPIIEGSVFTSVCAPRRNGSDAHISHLPYI